MLGRLEAEETTSTKKVKGSSGCGTHVHPWRIHGNGDSPVSLVFKFRIVAFMASVSTRGQKRKQFEWKEAQTQKDCE